jgi:hypothetical protein
LRYGFLAFVVGCYRKLLAQLIIPDEIMADKNESFARAHERHGVRFEEAFDAVTRLDPLNAAHSQIAENIFNSPDPGERLMALRRELMEKST